MTRSSAEGRSDGFDHDLRDLLDDQRHRDAIDARRRRHGLHQQAGEAGTLAGVLLDLGEQERPVVLTTTAGRQVTGVVATLGADFIGLRTVAGRGALIAIAAITALRPEPGSAPSVGDRLVEVDSDLHDLLAALAAERPRVSIHTTAGDGVAGHLAAVGADVVTIGLADGQGSAHLPLGAICEVVLP